MIQKNVMIPDQTTADAAVRHQARAGYDSPPRAPLFVAAEQARLRMKRRTMMHQAAEGNHR
jgi:hypothetical protein